MARSRFLAFLVLLLPLVAGCALARRGNRPPFKKLSPPIAYEMMRDSPEMLILDLRAPQEFNGETGHLRRATNIPLERLPFRLLEISPYRETTVLVYCRADDCGEQGMKILLASGFQDAVLMDGGIDSWIREGFKTVLPDELANRPGPHADGRGPVMPRRPGELEAAPRQEVPVEPPPPNRSGSAAPCPLGSPALRGLTPGPPLPDGRGGTRTAGFTLWEASGFGKIPLPASPLARQGEGDRGVRPRRRMPSRTGMTLATPAFPPQLTLRETL